MPISFLSGILFSDGLSLHIPLSVVNDPNLMSQSSSFQNMCSDISFLVIPIALINVIRGFYITSAFLWMFISWNERRPVEDVTRNKED